MTNNRKIRINNRETYDQSFRESFALPDNSLNEDLQYNSISEWDSIGHMVYPVSGSWTEEPDCLREGFSSSLTQRGDDDDRQKKRRKNRSRHP